MLAPLKILDHLKNRLAETLETLPSAVDAGNASLVSLLLPLPRVPDTAPQLPGRQFQFVHGGTLRAGYGRAVEWDASGPTRMRQLAQVADELRAGWCRLDPDEAGLDAFAMLGFAASPDPAPQVEDHLPNAILWVPEIGIRAEDGEAVLVLSAALPASREQLAGSWHRALDRLVPALFQPVAGPLTAARLVRDFAEPDFHGWSALVRDALAEIDAGRLEKVVLSRRLDITGPRCFDVGRLIGALSCLFPSCQIINLRRNGKSFVAATPERLLSRRAGSLSVDAIAGTAGRAESAERDAALSRELRRSEKNLREHRYVVDAIIGALADCCLEIVSPAEPEVLQLTNAQHLCSRIEALPSQGIDIFELAERLHPTPATNGQPRERARQWLRVGEPFDRGWYTGAAGILEPDLTGDLWVLLRCARICADRAELYAGAGIVAGSEARAEWDETEAKLDAMLTALQYA